MTENDPKQVIIEYISEPLGQIEPEPPLPPGVEHKGYRGITRKGGGLGAKVQTIRFLQERTLPDLQLHALTFENEDGQQEHYIWCVRQDMPGHWRSAGGANFHPAENISRGHPWVNLAGGWSRNFLWAGGRVLDDGLDVVRVRLISENGIVLEDTVQDGLALFISDRWVERPLQVELYDRSEKLLGTHQALKTPEHQV